MTDCFIIMPISTPDQYVNLYAGDDRHFRHVLDYLFKPVIIKAGFNPIPPIMEGSDIIHAEIIRQLEEAEIVLCDMSTLNANVFFELGIRTALDKPVCIVKDYLTVISPFDTSIINHHTYDNALTPWTLDSQIEVLAEHLNKSLSNSEGRNTLWKYFGLTARAKIPKGEGDIESKIDMLSIQLETLQRQREQSGAQATKALHRDQIEKQIIDEAQFIASQVGARFKDVEKSRNRIVLYLGEHTIPPGIAKQIVSLGHPYGIVVQIESDADDASYL
jgi:hypothetical protein